MKSKLITLISLFLLVGSALLAQHVHFPTEGIIEYEKRVNTHALVRRIINKDNEAYIQKYFDEYKKTQPQFKSLKSTLTFSNDKTLFTPAKEESSKQSFIDGHAAVQQNNIIYTDLATKIATAQKKVFEQTFLLKDSIRQIKWKITNETREIAGYSCRRANAVIMDSIYVVAFYTDNIPVSAGPESFTGLPGMILGVALPHENVTWFATSVTEKSNLSASIKPPVKGKSMNLKELQATIKAAMKNWGSYANEAIKVFLL